MDTRADVVIVGAGLAGLCCARRLLQANVSFQIVEASDAVGGRVRTDVVDGFQLDWGLQLFLPELPENRRLLDYDRLQLRSLEHGIQLQIQGKSYPLLDPTKHFVQPFLSLFSPIGTVSDKLRLTRMRWLLDERNPCARLSPDVPAIEYLRWQFGFSDLIIDRLFRPLLGGMFFDRSLHTSYRCVEFLLRALFKAAPTIATHGIHQIPLQLAEGLPPESIRLNTRVAAIEPGEVRLENGEVLTCRAVVIATDGPTAVRLSGNRIPEVKMNGSVTVYFAAPESPTLGKPIMSLDGDGTGPANLAVCLSDAAPEYAPKGQSLIAVQVIGIPQEPNLESRILQQLEGWYGSTVKQWRHLRTNIIPNSLPDQTTDVLTAWERPVQLNPGLYVCGDHRDQGSMNGAMTSGFRTAQAVAENLERKQI